jgi:hypothetical protein
MSSAQAPERRGINSYSQAYTVFEFSVVFVRASPRRLPTGAESGTEHIASLLQCLLPLDPPLFMGIDCPRLQPGSVAQNFSEYVRPRWHLRCELGGRTACTKLLFIKMCFGRLFRYLVSVPPANSAQRSACTCLSADPPHCYRGSQLGRTACVLVFPHFATKKLVHLTATPRQPKLNNAAVDVTASLVVMVVQTFKFRCGNQRLIIHWRSFDSCVYML